MTAIYAVRDKDGRVGLVDGRVADRSCPRCCAAGTCVRVWRCDPCFAGQNNGQTVCGCAAGYPTRPIWVCQDATCDCAGVQPIGIGNTIIAAYDFAPGVEWCFTVTSQEKLLAELDPEETVVGFGPNKCVKCGVGSCNDSKCKKPKGRFIRPRRCNFQDPVLCPWVCANDVHDCGVHELQTDLSGQNTACCHFIGGPLDEKWFTECPEVYDYWTGIIPYKSCCACENCGGVYDFDQETGTPGCTCLIPTFPGGKLSCCCGTILAASFTGSFRLEFTAPGYYQWQAERVNCSYNNGVGSCHYYFTYSDQPPSDYESPWVPQCTDSSNFYLGVGVNPGMFCECNGVPQQHTTVSGSKTWNCNGGGTNYTRTTVYDYNSPKRKETSSARYSITRSNAPKCRAACGDTGVIGVPGRRTVISGGGLNRGGGGGGCAGCDQDGSGQVMTATLAEMAAVARSRTDRR